MIYLQNLLIFKDITRIYFNSHQNTKQMVLKLRLSLLALFCSLLSISQNINQPNDLVVCDDNEDGIAAFDLNLNSYEIAINIDPNLYEVSYFLTLQNAETGEQTLSSPYTNVTSPQTIYARLEEMATGDYETTSFSLIVLPTIQTANYVSRFVCTDGNQESVSFDLTSLVPEILEGTDPSGLQISYFISEADALTNTNALANPINTEIYFGNPYYARVENAEGCFSLSILYFQDSVAPIPIDPTPLIACATNGVANFDLASKIPEITEGLINSCDGCYQISFHDSYEDADLDQNPLPTQFASISQTVYVRLTDEPGICYSITTLELITNEGNVPEIGSIELQEVCPSYLENYDLTQFESTILNGLTGVNVSYFENYTDFTSDSNPISDATNYDLALELETIYVKVTDASSGCYAMTQIDFDYFSGCEVSCDMPLNMSFCYRNYDTREFTYYSSNNTPLVVNFNAGSIHLQDRLIILDSDGTTELYNSFGNSTGNGSIYDLSGLGFMSTGDSITVKIQSNYNNSCSTDDGYDNWDYNVFCAGSVGTINVSSFLDENADAIFNPSEHYFHDGYFTYEKNNDGIVYTISSSTGHFLIASESEADTYDINFYLYTENLDCYNVNMASFTNVVSAIGDNVEVEVPVEVAAPCEDLAVYLLNSAAPPRPGFLYTNFIMLQNLGVTTISSGTINYTFDPLLEFDSATTYNTNTTITNTSTGITIDFVNLAPGAVAYVYVTLNCPATVALGELVTNTASYLNGSDDLVIANNDSSLSQVVVGSYDPNDIMESHGNDIVFDDFIVSNEYLYYTIRFQNVGTAEATFIRIEDALDPALDESTFRMLRSSHDYVVTRTGTDLEWYFDDINLPAQQDDDVGSQGFVYFKIKPYAGYAIGDLINNTASIYFDFNDPVITNTFETTFVETLSTNQFAINDFSLSPNPAKDTVTITMKNNSVGNCSVQILDLQGKQILSTPFLEGQQMAMDVSALQSGLYFVKLKANGTEGIRKLVVE